MQRRLTDDEQKQIQEVCGELEDLDVYVSGRLELTEKLLAMLKHNTTDGRLYVEPELTDEDARERPWVMCRDQDDYDWQGPLVLIDKLPTGMFVCRTNAQANVRLWRRCRRATPDEIVTAGGWLEVTQTQ
jgi:hypothetical protein